MKTDKDIAYLVMGSDGVFDQECKFGQRTIGEFEGHAVYCTNPKCPARKCHYGWYTGGEHPDNECPFFEKKVA